MSFDQWYYQLLRVAELWRLRRSDVESFPEWYWIGEWRKGNRPKDSLIAAMQDAGLMDENAEFS